MIQIDLDPQDIISLETKRLWNILNTIKKDSKSTIDNEEYYLIKYGIKIKCPIWYLSEEWFELYPNTRKVSIKGYGKYKLNDFMNEKENRDNLMRSIIINNLNDDSIIEGRT